METVSDFQSECEKMLECPICMEKLDNPKVLHCQHVFCKECLDDMLRFQKDGSGVIICPMKCEGHTVINSQATTNELKVPYQLKGILGLLKDESKRSESSINRFSCQGRASCSNDPSFYCCTCHNIMCQQCKDVQECQQVINSCLRIKVDEKRKQFSVVCEKHKTNSNYLCLTCENKFICVYCKEREHQGHPYETVKSHADRLREILVHPDYGIGNIEGILSNAYLNKDQTTLSVTVVEHTLRKALQERKFKRLLEYISVLDNEERRLLEEFKSIADAQIQKYPEKKPVHFYKDILEKTNSQIVLQRQNILNNVDIRNITVPSLSVGLTPCNESQKLGNITVQNCGNVHIHRKSSQTTFSHSITTTDDISESCSSLLKNLIQLQKEVYEVIPSQETVNRKGGRLAVPEVSVPYQKNIFLLDIEDVIQIPLTTTTPTTNLKHSPKDVNLVLDIPITPIKSSGRSKTPILDTNGFGLAKKVLIMDNVMPSNPRLSDIKYCIEHMEHQWLGGAVRTATFPYSEESDKRLFYDGEILSLNGEAVNYPFALAEFRYCNKMRDRRDEYIEIMETQAVVEYMANEFNKVSPKESKRINFIKIYVMLEWKQDRTLRYYNMYRFSEYLRAGHKYTFNIWCSSPTVYSSVLDAFSHWTYEVTEGFLLVGNLKGYEKDDMYVLSDPSIHCKCQMFGLSNLGDVGVEMFFKDHVCGDVCRAMKLSRNGYMRPVEKRDKESKREKSMKDRGKERKKDNRRECDPFGLPPSRSLTEGLIKEEIRANDCNTAKEPPHSEGPNRVSKTDGPPKGYSRSMCGSQSDYVHNTFRERPTSQYRDRRSERDLSPQHTLRRTQSTRKWNTTK